MKKLDIVTLKKNDIKDFAYERNRLLKGAKGEWVFFLDSDEKLTPELSAEIDRLLKVPNLKILNGFYIKRKIFFLGEYVGIDRVLRLGRRKSGKWKRAVHETWDVGTRFGTLRGYIIHNTAGSIKEYIKRLNKYSDIHAKENSKEGKGSNAFRIIAYPPGKFFLNIIYGRGFVFSMLQSFHSFLSWAKQWELQKK
jgi:hypothetical protein